MDDGGEGGNDVGGGGVVAVPPWFDSGAHEDHWNVLVIGIGRSVGGAGAKLSEFVAMVEKPILLADDDNVATAAGVIAEGGRAGEAIFRGEVFYLLAPKCVGNSFDTASRGQYSLDRGRVVLEFVSYFGAQINVAIVEEKYGMIGIVVCFEGFFDLRRDFGAIDATGGFAFFHGLLGDGCNAVVGRQSHDVVPFSDAVVECSQEFSESVVEVKQEIMHLRAVGAKAMSDQIDSGKSDSEKVRSRVLAEIHSGYSGGGHATQVGIGVRACGPAGDELAKGRTSFADGVGEIYSIFAGKCRVERRAPGFACIVCDRMISHKLGDDLRWFMAVEIGGDPMRPFEPSNRVGVMAA